jgi:hypothetical protein
MRNHLLSRLGSFFVLIGIGLLILFIGSLFAREFSILYFLSSAVTLSIGSLLHRAVPKTASTRFSSIRRLSQRSRQQRDDGQIDDKEQQK